ncbi:hypothetical protein GCM10010336_61370 [Streptomyces goshikiensis]|nr:hypothetical protein GCM10010336_61370 [Streptomyces goshikiensis]
MQALFREAAPLPAAAMVAVVARRRGERQRIPMAAAAAFNPVCLPARRAGPEAGFQAGEGAGMAWGCPWGVWCPGRAVPWRCEKGASGRVMGELCLVRRGEFPLAVTHRRVRCARAGGTSVWA